jgi:hypothetical protein
VTGQLSQPRADLSDLAGVLAEARQAIEHYRAFAPTGREPAETWRQHAARGNFALLRLVQAIDRQMAPQPEAGQ